MNVTLSAQNVPLSPSIQTVLDGICANDIAMFFKKIEGSQFNPSKEDFVSVVHEILSVMTIRPKSELVLANFLSQLVVTNVIFRNDPELKSVLLEIIFQTHFPDRKEFWKVLIRCHLLKACIRRATFSIFDLLPHFEAFNFGEYPNQFFLFLLFTAEEFMNLDPYMYQRLLLSIEKGRLVSSLTKLYENFGKLVENSFSTLRDYVNYGCVSSTVEFALKFDDLDMFMSFCSDPSFKINGEITQSPFEVCRLPTSRPSHIQFAASFGSIRTFKYLIMNNSKSDQLPRFAVIGGELDIVRILEHNGEKIEGCLKVAVEWRRESVLRWILESHLFVLNELDEALMSSAITGHIESFKILVDAGADPNVEYETKGLLHIAAENQQIEFFRFLMELNTYDINKRTKYGLTPLHFAAKAGCFAIVSQLISNPKIEINPKDDLNETPLHKAAQVGSYQVVEVLLRNHSLEIQCSDNYGRTPISITKSETIKSLIMSALTK